MHIALSRHAERRIKERNITRRDIKKAIVQAQKIAHIENDKFLYYYSSSDRRLVVVTIKKRDRFKIITAYYENHL